MSSSKPSLARARLPRGFVDRSAADIRATERMLATIRRVYERYGFDPVETPMVEYTDALGKFLPDLDRPNEGVFSFQDDDDQWLSLRYDLTAPLARHVAEHFERLPKPYRSYRAGWVFRNEKPGPGRFRQFMQFDADTVGAAGPAADAEMCMMAADTLEALGIPRGQYVIKVNSRKVLDGVMEAIGLGGPENAGRRLTVLRAIDKLDRLGVEGVRQLLGEGRKDESGDFTGGAGLQPAQTRVLLGFGRILTFAWARPVSVKIYRKYLTKWAELERLPETIHVALNELEQIRQLVRATHYGPDRIQIDPSIVRGLEYYTGAVFEAQLTFPVPGEDGKPVVFGSVGGGGRYDGLVGRFRGEEVPATGFSIGVSRLASALKAIGKLDTGEDRGPVVVLVMDRDRVGDYQRLVTTLRNADIRAELYLGSAGMKAQMKYADRRNAPCVIIQGGDEKAAPGGPMVQIKDLAAGKAEAAGIASNEAWRAERPGQFTVPEGDLVAAVRRILEGGR